MKVICYIIVNLFLFANNINAKEYRCIVSLAPSVTKSLYELGEEEFVKGITLYCPKGKIKKEIIGTMLEPDIEKIVSLYPDLIIATKDGNNKLVVEKLKRLGLNVYVMEAANSFDDICENYYALSKKLNKVKEAEEIINFSKLILEQIYDGLKIFNKLKLFWIIDSNPLYTAGNKNFLNGYNHYTKTVNLYENVNQRYFSVDIENVIKRNPDVIILLNVWNNSKEDIKYWFKYKMINAVKKSKIFVIKTENIIIPTPLTFSRGVIVIAKIIYGDVFESE
ncbi:MAG: helical backbone metal receptor [Endomicrobium sp.]|nr:helical backbone metal receptor [Endomicrobium sp.]